MVNKKWEFLEGKEVYLYPSSNADDGGDVNSEKNLSEISHKFTSRNFVIRRNKDDEPLKVTFSDKIKIHIADGEAVIEGYYAAIKSKGEGSNTTFTLDSYHLPAEEAKQFLRDYKNLFTKLYEVDGEGNWIPKKVSKKFKKDNPLPCLHVIIKLLKNTTGNLRGDITERSYEDPSLSYRVCKGLAISVCTENELNQMDCPYIDLAWIYLDPNNSNFQNLWIHHIVNNNSRYTYIDEDYIITDDGMTIREWVEYYVKDQLGSLDTLTHINKDVDEPYKDTTLSVNPDDIEVTRWEQSSGYDDEGNPVVEPVDDFNETYSIDRIQRRTHVTSTSEIPNPDLNGDEALNSEVAHEVDSRDDKKGTIEVYQTDDDTIHKKTRNINGKSKLLARGDHTHDGRYIYTESATESTASDRNVNQTIGTSLKIIMGLFVGKALNVIGKATLSGGLNVAGRPEEGETEEGAKAISVNGGIATVDNRGNILTYGNITGYKVFNAVWNDYADFLPKSQGETYEPGDLICKKRGFNEYVPSNLDDASLVVGVLSDTYGTLLGGDRGKSEEENKENYIPVAVAGNVRAKVVGQVYEGDFIAVSSIPGVGMAVRRGNDTLINLTVGQVVGKALQDKTTEGVERILIQVMLR